MKKIISAILTVFMLVSVCCTGAFAEETPDTVRIEFCVGDDTLLINGSSVQVETPYVVGVGVTLVPLRVITEAFGAKVEWIDATQSIDLSYPDVEIHLQIGNPTAEVNGRAETLLSAPELTNSHTMVPLRFISETFGATVTYDEATERIVVIKENAPDQSLVEGAVTNARIGDSYYGWSMENPTDMQLDYRSFDGIYTEFVYDDMNYMSLLIDAVDDEYDFEKDFNSRKNSLQSYTLVKADKDSSNSAKKTMHFQVKDKSEFGEIRIVITDKYLFSFVGTFGNEDIELRDEFLRLMSTFDTVYSGDDIHDYSVVKNGMRTFEAEHLKLSFDVPADYYMVTSDDAENRFVFGKLDYNDWHSEISAAVYSKSDVGSAEELANKDYTNNKRDLNEDLATFGSGVESVQYGIISAYEYSYEINAASEKDTARDIFFELGDYVYNFYICQQLPCDDIDSVVNSVMNSIKAEQIDSGEVGILMRNVSESTGTYTSTFGDVSLELPNNYEELVQGNQAIYSNQSNGVSISLHTDKTAKSVSALRTFLKEAEKTFKDSYSAEVILSAREATVNGVKCAKLVLCVEQGDEAAYLEYYAVVKNACGYVFIVAYPELAYSENARSEIAQIVTSLK